MTPASSDSDGARRKVLVFHIGDHKTGTTAIQYAFLRGDVRIGGAPVFYPCAKGRFNHNLLPGRVRALSRPKGKGTARKAHNSVGKLAARIARAKAPYALISAEHFEGSDPGELAGVIDTHFRDLADEIRIVAYVRPHAARILSSFATQAKSGQFMGSLEAFVKRSLDSGRFAYHARFSRWRAQFGEAFILRPFVRDELRGGSAVDDFAHHAFGGGDIRVARAATANESLGLEDVMRLRVVHSHLGARAQKFRRAVGQDFLRMAGAHPPEGAQTKLRLHRALARRIRDACLEDAQAMDADFFGGTPVLARDLEATAAAAPEAAQSFDPRDHLPANELRSLHMLADMLAGLAGLDDAAATRFLHERRVSAVMAGDDAKDEALPLQPSNG